jgi:hypothetical protein
MVMDGFDDSSRGVESQNGPTHYYQRHLGASADGQTLIKGVNTLPLGFHAPQL